MMDYFYEKKQCFSTLLSMSVAVTAYFVRSMRDHDSQQLLVVF